MSDGSLIFDTKIDQTGFEKSTNTLKKSMKSFVNTITNMGNSASHSFDGASSRVLDLKGKIEQTEKQIQQLKKEMSSLSNTTFKSKEAMNLQKQIEQTEKKMLGLLNLREQLETDLKTNMTAMGLPAMSDSALKKTVESSAEWKKLSQQISQTETRLKQYEATLEEVALADSKVDAVAGKEYKSKQSKLEALINKLEVYKTKLGEVEKKERKTASSSEHLSNTSNKTARSIKKTGDSAKKSSKKMNGFGKSIAFALKMFGMTIMFQAFSSIINGVTQGFQNLTKYSDSTNKSASLLMSSLLQLKNALATAFSPILNVVTPILNNLIQLIIKAITAIAHFFAALTGQKTFTVAQKVNEDYAASLDKTGSAAEENAKKAKRALASFDELNNINGEDKKGSGGGGGGGLSPDDMFDTVEVESKYAELANKVKEFFNKIFKPMKDAWDTYGQGVIDAWETALENVIKLINSIGKSFLEVWTNGTGTAFCGNILMLLELILEIIGDIAEAFNEAWNDDGKGTKLIQSMFDLFNSILELIISIGKSLRTVWNNGTGEKIIGNILEIFIDINKTITNIAKNLKKAWNKDNIGTKIIQDLADIFNGMLESIRKITDSFAKWSKELDFTPLLKSFREITQSSKPLGEKVGEGLEWLFKNALQPMSEWAIEQGIPATFDSIASALGILNETIDYAKPLLDWLIKYFIKPLAEIQFTQFSEQIEFIRSSLENLENGLKNLKDLSITDILKGIFEFGEDNPFLSDSARFGGMIGSSVVEGFDKGMKEKNLWSGVKGVFSDFLDAVFEFFGFGSQISAFKKAGKYVMDEFSLGIKEKKSTVVGNFEKLLVGIKDVFKNIREWFKNKFTEGYKGVKDAFKNIREWFGEKYTAVKKVFTGIKETFQEFFRKALTGVQEGFQSAPEKIQTIFKNIKNVFTGIKETFHTFFTNAATGAKEGFISAVSRIRTIYKEIKNVFSDIKSAFKSIFDKAVQGIKESFKGIGQFFEDVWSDIKGKFSGKKISIPLETSGDFEKKYQSNTRSMLETNRIAVESLPVPKLASGAVIPPKSSFLAVLGDQKRGTNIEAPLKTIEEAVRNVVGNGGNINLTVNLDGKVIFETMIDKEKKHYDTTGEVVFVH